MARATSPCLNTRKQVTKAKADMTLIAIIFLCAAAAAATLLVLLLRRSYIERGEDYMGDRQHASPAGGFDVIRANPDEPHAW